jgi:hypothetical protein
MGSAFALAAKMKQIATSDEHRRTQTEAKLVVFMRHVLPEFGKRPIEARLVF